MARLRIRVELNRGGVGVPLHKLASVVQEAQRFFEMLADDVHLEKDRGEWLAFDFDNESLNFTAEYVGPASPEQVSAFSAAFDGVTSLRRATIAQFTRIADAIGEDELIGFGLYHSDHETEPSEWRCLSRRDALRIADEIQLLLGASGELDQETHLPAVIDPGMGARIFKERHDRGSTDQSKWPGFVRDVESNLSRRITSLEATMDQHSQALSDLRETSGATEESVRSVLTAVESFCSQATRQLERLAPATPQLPAPTPPVTAGRSWRAAVIAAFVVVVIASATLWFWPSKPSEPAASSVAASTDTSQKKPEAARLAPPVVPTEPKPKAAVVASRVKTPAPAPRGSVMHIELEAREPAWVALTDVNGTRLLAKTLAANESHTFELTEGATLRTGNAGGLVVRFNGKEIGPLGPTGKIRDVQFKDGTYKIRPPDAG